MIGDTVSHYNVIQQLGEGGMGVVYEAEDVRLHRRVALKFLADDATNDPLALERFRREAEAASALNHPHICTIYDIDAHEGRPFIVMEKLSGTTLNHLIAYAPLRVDRIVSLGSQIADALNAAHAAGIIHRDIKPANIFITERGDAKLLDFGLARLADRPASTSADTETDNRPENLTRPGTTLGTIAYMSPEQARGETVDPRSDLFSLGGVLYEMATGVQPFRGGTIPSIAAAILTDQVPPPSRSNPDIPQQLDHVILGALEKDRELRVQSAAALRAELLRVVRDSRPQIAAAPRRTVRWQIPAAAGALAVAVAIAVAVTLPQRRHAATRPHEIHSILVLPFENQSHDPNSEYLSDGIVEGLIGTLAALPDVRVVARTTAFRFKGKPVDLQQIRKQLDVDAVVAGRLLSRPNDTIVQADLIDTASGTELWGARLHESNADVMNIEQQLVRRISDALRLQLTPAEQGRVAQQSTHNSEAYKLYLQGRFYWNKRNAEAIVKAREFFTQAITVDPQFAVAYSGLADSCTTLATFRVLTAEEGFRCARDAAQTALRLDPGLAEAHASLGLIYNNRFQWAPAEREFKRALELNPNYSNALVWYSLQLLARNQPNESLAMMRTAEQIDPLSAIVVANVAMRLNSIGDFRAALPEAQKAIELDPRYEPGWWQAGLAYEGLGNRDQAIETYRRGKDAPGPPGTREAMIIRLNMLRGNVDEAKRLARSLEARANRGEVAQAIVGWGYSAIGDRDKTFFWLNRGLAEREPALRDNRVKYSDVRDDPRFAELTNRLARGFDD